MAGRAVHTSLAGGRPDACSVLWAICPEGDCSSCSWLLRGPGSRPQGRTDHLGTTFQPPALLLRPPSSPGSTWSACKVPRNIWQLLKPVPPLILGPLNTPVPGQGPGPGLPEPSQRLPVQAGRKLQGLRVSFLQSPVCDICPSTCRPVSMNADVYMCGPESPAHGLMPGPHWAGL